MTFRLSTVITAAVLSGAFVTSAFAQGAGVQVQGPRGGGRTGPRDAAASQPAGTATLRGRIVGGESGSPLRHAVVRLSGMDMREGKMATTDEQGRWEIRNLPAGRFELNASKGGYVSLNFGQRRPFEQGRPIEIADGQTLENVNFNLPRGGVIVGRITDEYGDPVAEAMVAVLRYTYFNGQRTLVPVGRFAQSDDGGNFRLYGLAPGAYYLSASLRGTMMGEAASDNRSGYAPTYYPGTPNAEQAERITVGLGAEVSGVSFSLLPVRVAKITGTAIDSEGKPMIGAFVMLMENTEGGGGMFMMSFGGGGQVDESGHFTVNNVSPGDYTLTAQRMEPPGKGGAESAQASVSVNGEDITGVTLTGSKGTSIRGTVSFDTQPPAGSVTPAAVGIYGMPRNPHSGADFMAGGGPDMLGEDWSFELRAMNGPIVIRVARAPAGYSLKGVFLNGDDVTDTGIAFKSGDTITGVQVVLTTKTTSVSGTVSNDQGQRVTDYAVVVFADDPAKWGFMSRQIALARPDQQGGFQVKNLPPGKYLAVALDYLEDGEQSNPETLEKLRASATALTITEGDQKSLPLKLVTNY